MYRANGGQPATIPTSAMRRRFGLQVLTLLALTAMALLVGCSAESAADDGQRGYRGRVQTPALERPDFTMLDMYGEPYDFLAETEGKLTYLFVGYTHCPDVCPIHMASIASVLNQMPEYLDHVAVVFVTADPERDTPERMQEWLRAFSPRFVGLRATEEELRALESTLGLPPSAVPVDAEGNYAVGHAAQVIAFSPHGPSHVVYPFGSRQADYANDLPRLMNDRWEEG